MGLRDSRRRNSHSVKTGLSVYAALGENRYSRSASVVPEGGGARVSGDNVNECRGEGVKEEWHGDSESGVPEGVRRRCGEDAFEGDADESPICSAESSGESEATRFLAVLICAS